MGGTAPVPGYVVVPPDVPVEDAQEQAALNAALTYYGKAEAGDYMGTYQMLSPGDTKHFSAEQWVHANKSLETSSGRFVIHGIKRISPVAFDVYVTVYMADGSSFERTTHFVQDGAAWKHQLVEEETKMFDDAVKSP